MPVDSHHLLLPPLQVMSAMEESIVREIAVKQIQILSKNQSVEYFRQHLFIMIE